MASSSLDYLKSLSSSSSSSSLDYLKSLGQPSTTTAKPTEDLNQLGKNLDWYLKTGGVENSQEFARNNPEYAAWLSNPDPTKPKYYTPEAKAYLSKYPGFASNADLGTQLEFIKQYDPNAKIVTKQTQRTSGGGENLSNLYDDYGNPLMDTTYDLEYDASKLPKPKGGSNFVNMGEYQSDREIDKKYSYLDPIFGPMTYKGNIKQDFNPVDTFGPMAVGALASFGFPMLAYGMSGGALGSLPSLGAGLSGMGKVSSLTNLPKTAGQLVTGGFNPASLVNAGLSVAGAAGALPSWLTNAMTTIKPWMSGANMLGTIYNTTRKG